MVIIGFSTHAMGTSSKLLRPGSVNGLFMCQDENENKNEPEDANFRLFLIKPVTNELGPLYYDTLKDRFFRHALPPERTIALVFVFVFVLAQEQAIK